MLVTVRYRSKGLSLMITLHFAIALLGVSLLSISIERIDPLIFDNFLPRFLGAIQCHSERKRKPLLYSNHVKEYDR